MFVLACPPPALNLRVRLAVGKQERHSVGVRLRQPAKEVVLQQHWSVVQRLHHLREVFAVDPTTQVRLAP
jgi:hypothetical protein